MPILCYTTKIDPIKTIAEISQCLVKHGARKIVSDYDEDGLPTAVTFWIEMNGMPVYFSLPCNWEGVLAAMKKDPKVPRGLETKEQALRVSWRIIKEWVEAQMAIVEAQLAGIAEVFLPYAVTKDGSTLYKKLASGDNKLLLS